MEEQVLRHLLVQSQQLEEHQLRNWRTACGEIGPGYKREKLSEGEVDMYRPGEFLPSWEWIGRLAWRPVI